MVKVKICTNKDCKQSFHKTKKEHAIFEKRCPECDSKLKTRNINGVE